MNEEKPSYVTGSVSTYTCLRCEKSWIPRKEGRPMTCPRCHSAWWFRPRTRVKKLVKENEIISD